MSILKAFELVDSGRAKPFITLRESSITFSKGAVQFLNYPEYVHMYIDHKGRRVAFKACEDDDAAFVFYRKPKEGRSMLVRISGKGYANKVIDLAGVEVGKKGLRYYGQFVEDEGILVFDMSQESQAEED